MKKLFLVSLTLMFMLALTTWVIAGDSNSDWSPQYGEKGELLNPQPAVNVSNIANDINISEPPLILTTLLSEDFESEWTPDLPPTGWSIIDNGTEGSQCWWTDDWHRDYYSTWSDTAARIYYSGSQETNYEEWLITPSLIIPGGATACSLVFHNYYNDDGAGKDTAYVLGSIDDGATWTDTLAVWDADQASAYLNFDITGYSGQSTVKFAFLYTCNTGNYGDIYYWWLDEVAVYSDDSQLLFEEFSGWGPGGNDPPTGWTIIDNGTPKDAEAPWNNNDWHKYTRWSSETARLYYESSYKEWSDEWMISPSITISSGALCTLSVVEYYYHSTGGYEWKDMDHGYILVSTDGGTTWPDTIANHTATQGSSTTKTTFSYDIAAYGGQTIKIAFNFVNGPYGYDYWNIDDVSVDELIMAAYDVLTSAINAPTWGITGYDWGVSSQVTNIGLNTVTFEDSTYIYELTKLTHFFEDFSNPQGWTGANPPINTLGTWAVIDSGDGADGWNNNDWYGYWYSTWSDTIARVYWSPVENQNEWLITPSLNLTGQSDIHLTFKTFYNDYTGDSDTAYVLGTTDDWTTTYVIGSWFGVDYGSSSSPAYPDFDISSWADGSSNVKIAFKYVAYDAMYWYVDKVELYSILPPTVDYVSGETVVDLVSLESRDISYSDSWNSPDAGNYQVTSFTALGTDEDTSNDTLSINITVYEHYEHGGPDDGYYLWNTDKDGGTGDPFAWIDISTIGTPVTWDLGTLDNRYTSSMALGFDFSFYGTTYGRVFLSENGFISFDTLTSTNSVNYQIPSTSGIENMIAFLWDDLSGVDNGAAYYYTNNIDTFIVTYENWDFDTDHDQRIDMQVIMTGSDNGIKMQYNDIGPLIYLGHTIGIENALGDIGLEYIYNGTPLGNVPLAGLAITFNYEPPAADVAAVEILSPGGMELVGQSFTPQTVVTNLGTVLSTFPVYFDIFDEVGTPVYNGMVTITDLVGLESDTAVFDPVTVSTVGEYSCTTYTVLVDDSNTSNDSLWMSFDVYEHFSEGGPDFWGYSFIDNMGGGLMLEDPPVFSYIDITATGDTAGTGTGNYGEFEIGFPFDFYGQTFDSVFVNGYGYLTFGDFYSSSSNDCPLPNSSTPNNPLVAAFWDYGYCNSSYDGACLYETFGTEPDRYMVIQYHNWRRSSYNMEWEIILYENGQIIFQYLDIDDDGSYGAGQSATVGMEDDAIPSGFTYLCSDDNPGNRLQDELAIKWYYLPPEIDVTPTSIAGQTQTGGSDSDVMTISNTGPGNLNYIVRAAQDPMLVGLNSDEPIAPQAPIGYVPANDKDSDGKSTTVPVYPPMVLGSGGPDEFGYVWIDSDEPEGPVYGWIDISTIGTEVNWPEATDSLDDQYVEFAMGMMFNFYGANYENLTICTNGWASFLPQTNSHLSDDPIPDTDDPNALLAVYWDDLEGQYPTGVYGSAYYYYDATENRLVVSWTDWHHYANAEAFNFQIILDADDNTIVYQYGVGFPHSSQTDYSIGIENEDGTVGLQVARSQAYVHQDLAVLFTPPILWLSVDIAGGTIPSGGAPVVGNVTMNSEELTQGIYTGSIQISSNDPDEQLVTIPVSFEVCDGGEITGTVFDEDGTTPLADVVVEAYNSVPELVGSVTTGVDGLYGFVVDPDTYSLTFAKDDYVDTSLTDIAVILCEITQVDDMIMYVAGFAYLPGDVNMALGIWPPTILGNDVTYLVGYFSSAGQVSCLLDGFWCSADINGDCVIIGSDVTALVRYFTGIPPGGVITPCPDYEPLWPPLPDTAPEGWPNCNTPPVTGVKIIPVDSAE